MSKTGMIAFAIAVLIGLGLFVANTYGLLDVVPHGGQIAVVVYAVGWIIIRYIMGRKGHFVSRRKPDQ